MTASTTDRLGAISIDDLIRLSGEPGQGDWFRLGYDLYRFDEAAPLRAVRAAFARAAAWPPSRGLEILAFIGTWCGDTHDQLPGFARILKESGFPADRLRLLAFDRQKRAPGSPEAEGLMALYAVSRLPTFVVLERQSAGTSVVTVRELGRITETPRVSLLADLAAILKDATPEA